MVADGVDSVSILDKNSKYRVGDTIVCSANGHPSPTYTWKSADGKDIGGDKLRVTGRREMEREKERERERERGGSMGERGRKRVGAGETGSKREKERRR